MPSKLAFSLAISCGTVLSAAQNFLLPLPPGSSNVTIHTGPLTDYSRLDPFAPDKEPRALMVSVYQPQNCSQLTTMPYMPDPMATMYGEAIKAEWPGAADNIDFTFAPFQMQVCPNETTSDVGGTENDAPLVLFSPGTGASRLLYGVLAAAVASHGYTVVTVDHPYETEFIEYSNSRIVDGSQFFNENNTQETAEVNKVRAADVIFVLNQLGNDSAVADLIPSRGPNAFDNSRAMVYGHSLGGATAIECLVEDERFVGGINMDGPFYGDVPVTTGIKQPFLLFSSSLSPPNTIQTWNASLAHANAFAQGLKLEGALHNSLSDVATVLNTAGFNPNVPPFNATLGSIKPQRAMEVMADYFAAFFELAWAADGCVPTLLQGPSPEFPEIVFKANDVAIGQ